jgi:hypothetical protein
MTSRTQALLTARLVFVVVGGLCLYGGALADGVVPKFLGTVLGGIALFLGVLL